jgi:hypothetical protein
MKSVEKGKIMSNTCTMEMVVPGDEQGLTYRVADLVSALRRRRSNKGISRKELHAKVYRLLSKGGNEKFDDAVYEVQMDQLRSMLVAMGGLRMVGFGLNLHVGNILTKGRLINTAGLLKKLGEARRCHVNVANLYLGKRFRDASVATGYGLDDDGVWRRHPWLVHEGRVVETTRPRNMYYGYELSDDEAIWFCWHALN